jgi:hypothetical protein
VTLTAHTLTITLANDACAAAEALQRRLDRMRRKIQRIRMPLISEKKHKKAAAAPWAYQ